MKRKDTDQDSFEAADIFVKLLDAAETLDQRNREAELRFSETVDWESERDHTGERIIIESLTYAEDLARSYNKGRTYPNLDSMYHPTCNKIGITPDFVPTSRSTIDARTLEETKKVRTELKKKRERLYKKHNLPPNS